MSVHDYYMYSSIFLYVPLCVIVLNITTTPMVAAIASTVTSTTTGTITANTGTLSAY